jgi:hypothetical protein
MPQVRGLRKMTSDIEGVTCNLHNGLGPLHAACILIDAKIWVRLGYAGVGTCEQTLGAQLEQVRRDRLGNSGLDGRVRQLGGNVGWLFDRPRFSTDPFRWLYAVFGSVSLSHTGARGVRDASHDALLGPARSMLATPQRLTVPIRRREKLRRPLVLSLALHLAILLCCLIVLHPPLETPSPTSEGIGAPTSVAMVMDVGSSEGVKQPTPS